MFKLLKYEMYSRAKLMAGVVIGIVFFNFVIIAKISLANVNTADTAMGLTFLIAFAAGVIAFIDGILSYRRDLYTESGYLTFTLPKRGFEIINSKLVASLIEIFIFEIIGGGFFIRVLIHNDTRSLNEITDLLSNHKVESIQAIILIILSIVLTFLLAYFSMTVSRATLGNRKYGEFFAIVLFFFLNYLVGKITAVIVNVVDNVGNQALSEFLDKNIVVVIIYAMFLCAISFVGTHLVLEKRVDL